MLQSSNPSTKTSIDYDDKRGRFLITCPMHDNGRVRGLPNRRWDAKGRRWLAPAIRANIEAIMAGFPDGTCVLTVPASEKLRNYAGERKGRVKPAAFPAWYGFKRQPRPKQMEALQKIHGLPAFALFMDMRTGKTKVLIDEACASRIEGTIDSMLLVCPLSLRRNWGRELEKDATIPYDVHFLDTKKPKEYARWLSTPHDFKILVVGVESLQAGSAYDLTHKFLATRAACLAAVDESTKIKTHNAERSKRVVSLRNSAKRRGILTGSVTTKSPLDIYMQFEFLDPDIIGIGDYYAFRNRYAILGGYEGKQVIGYDHLDELAELIEPYTFQVRQHEVIDVEKIRVVREVEMSDEQRRVYADLKKYSRIEIDDGRGLIVQNILEKMLRLQEVVGGHLSLEYDEEQLEQMRQLYGPSKKLPRTYRQAIPGKNSKLVDLMEAAEEYEGSTIVWCAFKDEIFLVAKALREKYGHDQVVELHGDIEETDRDRNVNELFQSGRARFIVGNAATGGMGLTMDRAENLFFFSNTYNYTDREQAEERGSAHGKSVLIVDFVSRGTVDEVIIAANEVKKDVSEFIRGKIDDIKRMVSG